MPNIYVLNKDGKPLMPSHNYARVRRMLKTGKACIACYQPFTIRLTYQILSVICRRGRQIRKKNENQKKRKRGKINVTEKQDLRKYIHTILKRS